MTPQTAQKLLDLLAAIDADRPKEDVGEWDFTDLVCNAREALPAGVVDELREIIESAPCDGCDGGCFECPRETEKFRAPNS
jgi:hypothetical protein